MVHNALSEKQLDSRFAIIGAPGVPGLLMHAKETLHAG